jgi:hypothetical protein
MGVAMSVLSVALAGQPLLGQVLPPPGSSAPGLVELLSNPAGWLTDMFNSALVGISNKTTGDVVGFMNWLLGSGNVISQTPAALSYDNAAVTTLWGRMCFIGNAALAVVTVWVERTSSSIPTSAHPTTARSSWCRAYSCAPS